MAKFTNYFKVVKPSPMVTTMADSQNIGDQGTYSNSTWYQRLVQGSASRLTRYREYDLMDNDVEIARSLDTIAEEMIGSDPNDDMPINLVIEQEKEQYINPSLVSALKAGLRYWSDVHQWNTRLFRLARVMVKYGDCFFIRRSDTSMWEYVHPKNVVAAIVDERDMTQVVGWQIKTDIKTPSPGTSGPAIRERLSAVLSSRAVSNRALILRLLTIGDTISCSFMVVGKEPGLTQALLLFGFSEYASG